MTDLSSEEIRMVRQMMAERLLVSEKVMTLIENNHREMVARLEKIEIQTILTNGRLRALEMWRSFMA